MGRHAFIERSSGRLVEEPLFGERLVSFLYSTVRECSPLLFRAAISPRVSDLLALLYFDLPWSGRRLARERFVARFGIDLGECSDSPAALATPRALFERRIRYWELRPLPAELSAVVSPADARVVVGSLAAGAPLPIKNKLFTVGELLGPGFAPWAGRFLDGDAAIFRLTPEKYHYTHTPVAGRVVGVAEIAGLCHSCNPSALLEVATPYSKNRRRVTLIDSDVAGGTGVGLVAMVEVVALMIGEVVEAYSDERYNAPRALSPGDVIRRGQPRGLFRPGSSTVVCLFEPGRVCFAPDLLRHAARNDVASLFAPALPWVETDVRVRSVIAFPS